MQVRVPLRVVPPSPPPTLTHLSLQEALRVFRPQFILESERRQRKVLEVCRGRGRVGTRLSPIGAKEEATSSQKTGRERVQKFVSVGELVVCGLCTHGSRLYRVNRWEGHWVQSLHARTNAHTHVVGPGRQRPKMTKREMYERSKRCVLVYLLHQLTLK